MDFVGVRTNINEFYGPVEARWVHGAYMIGIILAMQKKFKRFFMASNYSLADVFDVRSNFDDHFSFLQLDSFSNKNISFVYESMDLKRSGKMELIVKDPIVHTYLNVCGYGANNCGVCEKCIRTQCTLDIMNSLQDFSKVFDLKQYRRNRSRYLARLHGRRHQSVFYREFDSLYKRNKGSYPVMVYLYSPWFRITGFLRILTAKNENKFLWLRRLYRNKLRKCM